MIIIQKVDYLYKVIEDSVMNTFALNDEKKKVKNIPRKVKKLMNKKKKLSDRILLSTSVNKIDDLRMKFPGFCPRSVTVSNLYSRSGSKYDKSQQYYY